MNYLPRTPGPALFHQLAHLSSLAYLDAEQFNQAMILSGDAWWTHWEHLEHGNAQGIAVWDDDDCVIAAAGTNDISDALDDIWAWPSEFQGVGRTHGGMEAYARRFSCALLNSTVPYDKRRVVLTGHSLGGPAAALSPMVCEFGSPMTVLFGAPRFWFGKPQWKPNTHLVARPQDLVPDLPPPVGFVHHGTRWWLTENNLTRDQPDGWMRRARRAARIVRCLWRKDWSLFENSHHRIDGYRQCLAMAAGIRET